ncbi:MAG: glycosyltransferase family 4 protein [Planctomycetes bacterium]|nr:glycosyltransferase family 4 protein [Planctomycetota bacterium]MCB9903368.1 glycosyltransferase family 4 protein [Planctomycetota bacterium]
MRVGIDYRSALVNREGIGRYTRELVRGMVELGFDQHLGLFGYTLAGSRFSRVELGLANSRAELLRLRLPSKAVPWLLRKTGKGVDDLVGGCEVYHHTQPNLLHVREALEVVTIFDCIYMLDAGYMDPAAAERMTRVAREQVERARLILVPSKFVGAEVVMSFGVYPSRIAVTPLGCDHVVRGLPAGGFPPVKDPYILTVSRVDARKNHLRMLQAFERLVADGFDQRWIVAGPPGYGHEEFAKALDRSPARDHVEWRRDVPDSELPRLYSGAAVFWFVTLNEGYGLPPVEAMACGAPVITSCVTSLPEVTDGAALLVEPTDVDEIFAATKRVLTEAELASELRALGKNRARRLTWRECAKETLAAYRQAKTPAADEDRLFRSL